MPNNHTYTRVHSHVLAISSYNDSF
jgi:hypothetical protein